MMKNFIYKFCSNRLLLLLAFSLILVSCEDGLLDKQPLTDLSSDNFWNTSEDAYLALAGVYNKATTWSSSNHICAFDTNSDNGINRKPDEAFLTYGNLNPSSSEIKNYWNDSYREIAGFNFFLDNIAAVETIDNTEKAAMIAEVKFLRAYTYFNMYEYWGGVPLVTKVLTQKESVNITNASSETIYNFIIDELTEITSDLPVTRPANEHGRIVRAAALAIKGRLLMSAQKWAEAAVAYHEIIEEGVHQIDSDYSELFNGKNEESAEIIFSRKYLGGEVSNATQLYYRPSLGGGWHHINPAQSLVDSYQCIDGKSIAESPLYDAENPVIKNGQNYRDPRLLYTVFYPGISKINDKVYQGHPDSTTVVGDVFTYDAGMTGYCLQKFVDNSYAGDLYNSGVDIPIIRYAEVLLSYLECQIMSGASITRNLLDNTINQVRGRESVRMPYIIETDSDRLLEILKNERRVELAFEGLRFWDLKRWGELEQYISFKPLYGIKLTDHPSAYTRFPVGPGGHYEVIELKHKKSDLPWPIPQDELDINNNLEQKENWN